MTSDDTDNTDPGTPPCVRGAGRFAGTLCPGADECLITRRATLRDAYTAGCRSPEARAANTLKGAERRESKAQSASTGSGWDAPDVAASGREFTGEACQECDQPTYWTPGRAGQQCANGHWDVAPNTEKRIIVKPKREIAHDEKSSLLERIRFGARRDEIIRLCEIALAEIDVTEIETLCRRMNVGTTGWNPAIVRTYVSGFKTLISETSKAQTYPELNECEQTYRQLHDQIEYGSLLSGIHQSVADVAQRLDYSMRQQNIPIGYRVIPNTYMIEQYDRDNPAQYRYGSGTPIGAVKRRAITSGSVIRETDNDDDYSYDVDDDDDDNDDYGYDDVYSSASSGIPPIIIVGVLVIGLGLYAYIKVPPWWNREDYRICGCTNRHPRRPALARYRIDVNYTGIWVDHCGKKKCIAIARRYVSEQNGTGYEIREYELRDQYGYAGSSPEFTGVLKNG
jgi:hypothetical protein